MNTVNIKNIKKLSLPKRDIRILIGSGSPLDSLNMTFGVATVPPKTSMEPHMHKKEEEIIYILSGHGNVNIDGKEEKIEEGTVIKLDMGTSHFISNFSNDEMNFTFCFNPPVKIGSYDNK